MTDHERIWLKSDPGSDNPEYGRMWCQYPVWGSDATEYVRADLVATLRQQLEEALATITELQGLQVTNDICASKIRRDALEEAAQLVGQIRWVQFINGSGHHDCRKPLPSENAAAIRALHAPDTGNGEKTG